MIDYKLFQFACPPRCGAGWFVKAAQLSGLGPGFIDKAYAPFPAKRSGDVLRVSMVRHPRDWLGSCWRTLGNNPYTGTNGHDIKHLGKIVHLEAKGTFDEFVLDYLRRFPGEITRLFWQYAEIADSCLRWEDVPHAFLELIESAGVPESMRSTAAKLPKKTGSAQDVRWSDYVRREVMDADRKVFEHFDYY